MKKRIVVYIIFVQVIIIILLALSIYKKTTNVLEVSVNPIRKADIVLSPSDRLKYFYEPKANSERKDDFPGINATYTINSDSLNERYDYQAEKPKGTFRIIALGDSFTFGSHVDTKDNWSEKLEDTLNALQCSKVSKFEVVNLGVPGYDTAYEVERYKKRGQKYHPDLVVWYHAALMNVNEEVRKKKTNLLVLIKDIITSLYEPNGKILNLKTWYDAAKDVKNKFGEDNILDYQKKGIQLLSQYYNGKLIIVPKPEMKLSYKDFLQIISTDHNYYFADNLRNYYKLDGFFKDHHPNQKGHKIIAEDIFKYLKTNKLIPCN